VTKATKANSPSVQVAGMKLFETSSTGNDAGNLGSPREIAGGPCLRRAASKSEITDQIGLQLRSVYDDILAQPVPGRFLELLRQLESVSDVRSSKDGM
jgi:hypothetical protein